MIFQIYSSRVVILSCATLIIAVSQPSCHVDAFIPVVPNVAPKCISNSVFSNSRRYNHSLHAMKDNKSEFRNFDPLNLSSEPVDTEILAPDDEEDQVNLSVWGARGLLLLVAILWGTNFGAVKYLETLCFEPPCNHPPSEAALARFGVAALVSIPLLINKRLEIILAGLECGLWVTLGYFTQAAALSSISSGKCAFICSLTVVVVPLIEAVFFGKPMKPVNFASGALAIAGVGVLEGLVNFNELLGIGVADAADAISSSGAVDTALDATATISSSAMMAVSDAAAAASETNTNWLALASSTLGVNKGDIIALGQPLGFGISFMRIEHYVEKFKDDKNRIMTIAAAECVAVGLLSLLWVLIDFHGSIPNLEYMVEPHRIGAIAWTGIMTTVLAIYLEGFALQAVSATDAALLFASEPVWATLFGSWLLHEQLNINSYVGGAVILGACIISATSDTGEKKEEVVQ